MTYGTIKVDTVTFTDAGIDKSVTLSGLVQNPTFSGNVTVTGTISGVTVTGATANFISGIFSTQISGTTVTGTTASFTSGVFTSISGGTHTITSGVFAAGSAASPSISFTSDPDTGLYSPGANQVALSTNGTGRLFVDASGIIGVKRTTQGGVGAFEQIQIGGNAAAGSLTTFFGQNNGSAGGIISNAYYDASNNAVYSQTSANFGISRLYLSDGTLVFSNAAAGVGGTTASLSERLRITSAGLVGVGTSSPGGILDIRESNSGGTALAQLVNTSNTASSNARFKIATGGTSAGNPILQFTNDTSNWYINADQSDSFKLKIGTTVSDSKLVVDSSGLVGIGNSAPRGVIHVGADLFSGATDAAAINIKQTSTTASTGIYLERSAERKGYYIYLGGDQDSLNFQRNNAGTKTDVMTLTRDGLVGIGTTTVSQLLHVHAGYQLITNSTTGTSNGLLIGLDTGDAVISNQYTGALKFGTSNGEKARIDSSGRLLVGTSSAATTDNNANSPNVQLEGADGDASRILIRSNAGTTATAGPVLYLARSRGATANSKTAVAQDDSLGSIVFEGTDGTHDRRAAAITAFCDGGVSTNDMPGRLVFSTTADGASSPTERMRISQNGTVTINGPGGGTFLDLSNSGGYSGLHEVDNTAYTIGQNSDVRAMRIGSGANWLTTGVNLAPGGTSWGTYSDERLKTDIVELTDCLDNIKGIRCISYRLTDVDDANSKKRIGVIAQDLVGKYDEAINASRRSENDETEYLSVQYSDLIPVLLKALQEASVKIETLEAKVAALESA